MRQILRNERPLRGESYCDSRIGLDPYQNVSKALLTIINKPFKYTLFSTSNASNLILALRE